MLVSERRFIAACVLAALTVATVYNYSFQPVYRAVTVVSLQEASMATYAQPADKDRAAEIVNRQVGELNSLEFASTMVPMLGEPDAADLERGRLDTWFAKVQGEWNRRFGSPARLSPTDAIEVFRSRLVGVLREGSWIEIRYSASDPEVAVRVLKQVVSQVLVLTDRRNQEQRARASGELDQRLSAGKDRLEGQLDTMQAGRAERAVGDIDARRQLLQQQIRGFTDALVAAQTTRAGRAATLRSASQKDGGALSARNDPQLLVANGRVAELEDRERALLASLGDRHPDVAAVRDQLALARARSASLLDSFQRSADSQYQLALEEEGRLRDQVQRVQAEVAALDAQSVDYSVAKRKAEWTRYSLESMLQRGQVTADTFVEAKIVQPAFRPLSPFDPQRSRNYVTALAVGLLAGILWVVFADQFVDTVRLPDDFLRLPELRLLGSVPNIRNLKPTDLASALANAKDGFGDSLRVIRTNIVFSPAASRRAKVLVITSGSPQEGKSTTAVSLAFAMKEIAARVLLIDADLRRPAAHLAFDVPLRPGLSEIVASGAPVEFIPRLTSVSGLDLITAGNPQALSSACVGSDAMATLLDQARDRYDWVIVDAPPALALPDASVLATQADGVVVVCASEKTRLREIEAVMKQVKTVGGIVLGAVLNRVDMSRHSYYYGRAYSSYYESEDLVARTERRRDSLPPERTGGLGG